MSIFGEFSIIAGRVESAKYYKGNMDVVIGGRKLSMPLTSGTLINSFDAGSDMEFAVRPNLLMRREFTARAFRHQGEGKTHTSRVFHYWFFIGLSILMVALWHQYGLAVFHPKTPNFRIDDLVSLLIVPAVGLYGIFGILETREAVRLLERS